MIYRAVRFPEYVPDFDDDGEIIKPIFTGGHAPESGTDYSLTGQELLVSLCNLYGKLNNPESTVQITDAVWDWCRNNIHPYDINNLYEMLGSEKFAHITYRDIIQNDAAFSIKRFIKDLCDLGMVFELYFSLHSLKYYGDVDYARNLYYEGRLCGSLAFLERYRQYVDDKEHKAIILDNYNDHIFQVVDMFPDFRMRLKLDKKTGSVMFGADIQSVLIFVGTPFQESWLTLLRRLMRTLIILNRKTPYFPALPAGKYFVRHSSRQLYCDNPNCQAERNRKNIGIPLSCNLKHRRSRYQKRIR